MKLDPRTLNCRDARADSSWERYRFCRSHKTTSLTVQQHQTGSIYKMAVLVEDPWKEPVTALFAGIGLLYISLKIFSFWRLIASLFILPGTSVSILVFYDIM
jgi:hypothetical protein